MPRSSTTRRLFCAGFLAAAASPAIAAEPVKDISAAQDFDELWETLRDRYCFFDEKTTDWERVRNLYRPRAIEAATRDAYSGVLGEVLNELYDAHTHLADPPAGFPRFPPFDLVIVRRGEAAIVEAVLEGSAAAVAGLRVGDRVLRVEGQPVAAAAAALAPRCLGRPDPAAEAYAWNRAVAGRRGQPRRLDIVTADGTARTVALALRPSEPEPDLTSRPLSDGLGYIRIASFGRSETVAAFDAALAELRHTRGLVIDVRRNGGGDTAVARPIMGRFVTERRPYARMRRREGAGLGAFWTEYVDPRGPFTYERPVVVLADVWSASMAEGFPMGMAGLGRARVVGTPMMGLGAAVFPLRLDRTGLQAQYSAEPVYDVADRPRWRMRPDVQVGPGEDILAAGLAELRRLVG